MRATLPSHAGFPIARRPAPRIPWLLLGGYTVATFDMAFAIVFWTEQGASAMRVMQSIASWFLGTAAYSGGMATALFGAVLYGHLMWGVVALYRAMSRRLPVLLRRPVACGAAYGVLAYAAIFKLAVPLLAVHNPDSGRLDWTLACVAVYALLVGIPCALFSRAAAGQD